MSDTLDEDRIAVSLVICTTGEPSRMAPLGAALSAFLDANTDAEAIVVDNSAAGSVGFDDQRIRVVPCTARGLSFARATGCSAARGDVIVFTDDDVDFTPDWAAVMAAPVLAGEFDATASTVVLGDEFDAITSKTRREWLAEANLPGDGVRIVGAGMAFRRDRLGHGVWDQRLGAGAPVFAFGEEHLFELMLRDAGARVGPAPGARVVHHPDPARTSDDHYRRIALQKGLSDAYIAHHWFGERLPHPMLRLWRRRVRLWLHRLVRGGLDAELSFICDVGRARGHLLVAPEPQRYARRARKSAP